MPINVRDFNDVSVPVGSSTVSGVEHQTAHVRWGPAGQAKEVLSTDPMPVELRGRDSSAVAQALTAIAAGTKLGLSVVVVDSAGNIISNFGGTAGAVLPYFALTTAAVHAIRIKSGSGRLRSVHIMPSDTEVGPIFAAFFNSNSSPPAAGDTMIAKWGFGGGFPNEYVVPGGGIAFTNGLGIRVTKLPSLTDNTAVTADSLIMVTYE